MNKDIKTSSVVNEYTTPLTKDQFKLPTWGVIITLIVSLVILKSFIYIKDGKRHGK